MTAILFVERLHMSALVEHLHDDNYFLCALNGRKSDSTVLSLDAFFGISSVVHSDSLLTCFEISLFSKLRPLFSDSF